MEFLSFKVKKEFDKILKLNYIYIMTQEQRIEIIRQAHQTLLVQEGASIEGLLPPTQEDVRDEVEHLDALDHEQEVDFDKDENETDMSNVSLEMRESSTWIK